MDKSIEKECLQHQIKFEGTEAESRYSQSDPSEMY